MKVLLISGEFPPLVGGVGDYTACLATALHSLGVQVSVLTSARASVGAGFKPAPTALPFPVLAQLPRWGFGSWGPIRRVAGQQGAGIIHIQYQSAAYGLHPAINLLPLNLQIRAPDLRTVVTFHDLKVPYICPKAGLLRPWAVRALARWSHGVVCTDDVDLQRVSSWGLRRPPSLIPIGSNIPVKGTWLGGAQCGKAFPVSAHGSVGGIRPQMIIGYFGLLNQSKGVEILFRACRILRQREWYEKRGLQVTVAMVGAKLGDSDPTNSAYARRVQALAIELELDDVIQWTGQLSPEDTSRALQSFDICVLPYLEGASFRRGTLMAALAHGLPIVTTAPTPAPATGPHLEDGVNCRLVPSGDVGALAQALAELAGAPSLREKLAMGALELARSFTWEEIARRTVAAYEQVLTRST